MRGVGLIGCGRMGQVWVETVAAHPDCRVAVVFDPDPDAAAAKAAWETMETLRASAFPGLRPPERIILDWRTEAAPAWAEQFLQGVGVPAERSPFAGAEDPGTAFLAAIAQGAFRSMSLMARKVREVLERDAREAAAGEVIPS